MNITEGIVLLVAIVFNAVANILLTWNAERARHQQRWTHRDAHQFNHKHQRLAGAFLIRGGLYLLQRSSYEDKTGSGISHNDECDFTIVTVVAVFLFDERLSVMKIAGIAVIALGIWLVAMAK